VALNYDETLVSWTDLEAGLSMVASGDDKGPPDFYLSLDQMQTHRPLTKIATSQFGRLSGVRPAIYKEFIKNPSLTNDMIRYSMARPERGGHAYVAHTTDAIVGIYPSEKPYLGLKDSFDILQAAPGLTFIDTVWCEDGTFEFVAILGDMTASVTPGLLLRHGGRPMFGTYLSMHDQSAMLSELKAPKKRKAKEACETAAHELVANRANEAIGEADSVYNLASVPVTDPAKFLSRLSLMHGFSSQAAEKMLNSATEGLIANPSHYEVARFVASLAAVGETALTDRRFQTFSHYVAFRGASVCTQCGLPQ